MINFSQYQNFSDYCNKTKQDTHTAIKTVLENINNLSKEIEELKNKKTWFFEV